MTEEKDIQKSFDKLRQFRDELKVQLNLGKMEIKSAWEDIEDDFGKVEAKVEKLRDRGGEELERLRGETREMIRDVRKRFDNLRKRA